MAEICGALAGARWCVFPGADAKKVAEAELELPIEATASPATVALRVEKLEAENSALKSEIAVLKDENTQIPALKAESSRLKSANAALTSDNSRLKGDNAQIPALKAEIAKLKAEIDRLKAAPAPAKPTVGAPVPAQRRSAAITAGTLLAENAQAVESLPVKLQMAELLLAKDAGPWDFGEFKARVVGKAIVECVDGTNRFGDHHAGGVCGGFAAVPFQDKMDEFVADPTGASFVFSLGPTVARYPLQDKARALFLGSGKGGAFMFLFALCLRIFNEGDMSRLENTYAVPSGWKTSGYVKFTRLEVWRVTS
jgi:cell division protein FtsB